MKLPCEVVRDLLPLYSEDMLSKKSRELTEEHLAECSSCRDTLRAMTVKTPDMQFRVDSAQEFARYDKKKTQRIAKIIAIIAIAIVVPILLINTAVVVSVTALLYWSVASAKVEVDTVPSHYSMYMGEDAKEEYVSKWGMDESVFPDRITDNMNVVDYKMVYYNPWDAQYLSYLTVTYTDEDYQAELTRLGSLGVMPYEGIYSVTGFAGSSDPIALFCDDYKGFVYAIHTPGKDNTITYVELIFCNYSYDIDYEEYIPEEYLPLGFNAKDGNPYRKQQMKGQFQPDLLHTPPNVD